MTCPLCNDTGDQRYWEGRWRDEKAKEERLRALLIEALDFMDTCEYPADLRAHDIRQKLLAVET